jgi:hypothetical protein
MSAGPAIKDYRHHAFV